MAGGVPFDKAEKRAQEIRSPGGAQGHRSDGSQGREAGDHRAERIGQEHAHPLHERPGVGDRRRGVHRRTADDAQDARGAQPAVLLDGVPAVQPVPASDGDGKPDAGAREAQEGAQGGG